MNFREAPGRVHQWLDTRISSGFSNFLFIDRHYRSHSVLRRIFSLARQQRFQSLLIEELSETDCSWLAEEDAALRIRRPDFTGSRVHRLSFWRGLPGQCSGPDDFVGYAIFKSDCFSGLPQIDYIYESVMPPTRLKDQNNFIHCHRTYNVLTAAGEQSVSGVLYAQQNQNTFVCAHVGLRTAAACLLPEWDTSYARMNDLAGIDHVTRKVGDGAGLSTPDLERMITGLGLEYRKTIHEPRDNLLLPTEFQRDLYGIIESGCPALVGFELNDAGSSAGPFPRHIVPIIGHTFNDDAWVPDAQRSYFGNQSGYFSSESWLSSYLLHDDNFGPYYCLPRHFLGKDQFRLMLGLMRSATPLSATEAETVAFSYLHDIATKLPALGQDWYDRFAIFSRNGLLVLRALLVDRADYIGHLQDMRSWDNTALEQDAISVFASLLPERFWMIEASAQELFTASRRKFGEVLLHATSALPRPLDFSLMLAIRLPGILIPVQNGSPTVVPTNLRGHTRVFEGHPA